MSAGLEDSASRDGVAGPLEAYRALLSTAAEGILTDLDQEAAAERLQALHNRLAAAVAAPTAPKPFNANRKGGFWRCGGPGTLLKQQSNLCKT